MLLVPDGAGVLVLVWAAWASVAFERRLHGQAHTYAGQVNILKASAASFPMNSPSALDIQHHLYLSFLESRTCDVALRIRGSWHAVYRLHRVVLIQSVRLPGYVNACKMADISIA